MSASVVPYPSVKRSAPAASSGATPMAARTWLGCERPAGAGRPARDAHALLAEGHQQLLPLDARHAQVQVAREHLDPAGGRAGTVRCAPSTDVQQPVAQPVAQGGDPRRRRGALGRHQAQRGGQPDRARHVLGAAAPLALLPPAVLAGLEHDAAGDGQRADADRARRPCAR